MADYGKALEQGIEAAKRAEAAKREIADVFEDLKIQVLAATSGRVLITVKEREGMDLMEAMRRMPGLLRIPSQFVSMEAHEPYRISACNPTTKQGNDFALAFLELDPAGYPCTISWGDRTNVCRDKEAVSECLAELLTDPTVGQQLYVLTRLKPSTAPENN